MFKVFQTNGDPKQQRGDGRIPLSPPLNETLLSAAGLSQGMLFTRLVQSSHALCHTSFQDGLSFFEVTPECQMFDANPNPISVTFSPVYQPPSSACSAPGLNNHTVQLNTHVARLVAINFAHLRSKAPHPPGMWHFGTVSTHQAGPWQLPRLTAPARNSRRSPSSAWKPRSEQRPTKDAALNGPDQTGPGKGHNLDQLRTQLTAQLGAPLAKWEILGGLLGNGGSWEIGWEEQLCETVQVWIAAKAHATCPQHRWATLTHRRNTNSPREMICCETAQAELSNWSSIGEPIKLQPLAQPSACFDQAVPYVHPAIPSIHNLLHHAWSNVLVPTIWSWKWCLQE